MSTITGGGPRLRTIPVGDDRERLVCPDCGYVAYRNPLIIVGAVWFGLKPGAHHAPPKFVFTGLENLSGLNLGWFYILPIGLLMAKYTFTGYDASAHMTEETHNASRSGPRGSKISDGPFAEAKEVVGGYMLIAAKNFADAVAIAQDCPGFDNGSTSVEVRQIKPMP